MDKKKRAEKWKQLLFAGSNSAKFVTILISVLLWFLIKLSKDNYVHTLSFEVEYRNLPSETRLANDPPREVKLQLQGKGFSLLKYSWNRFTSIDVDISTLPRASDGRHFWVPDNQLAVLGDQLASDVDVLDVNPDTVYFKFTPVVSKVVPIVPEVDIQSNRFTLRSELLSIAPDSVKITGRPGLIDSTSQITTQPFVVKENTDSLNTKIKLKLPRQIKANRQQVEVKMYFESITEGEVKVPLRVQNVPDSLRLEVYPREVKVNYRVAMSKFGKVRRDAFQAAVDFSEIDTNRDKRYLQVRILNYPRQVESFSIKPKRVEYILTRDL